MYQCHAQINTSISRKDNTNMVDVLGNILLKSNLMQRSSSDNTVTLIQKKRNESRLMIATTSGSVAITYPSSHSTCV